MKEYGIFSTLAHELTKDVTGGKKEK